MTVSRLADANEIIPGVWIGNLRAAADGPWLKSQGITAVFNCTKNLPFHPSIPHPYRIPVDDNLQPAEINNMTQWASEIAYKILREFNQGHRMLIHCHAGMQRSTTACAFFLMVLTGKPLIQVMYLIRSKRPIAFSPRPNFADSLRKFEQQVQAQILPRAAPHLLPSLPLLPSS
jgi:dual specificity phosphatase 12